MNASLPRRAAQAMAVCLGVFACTALFMLCILLALLLAPKRDALVYVSVRAGQQHLYLLDVTLRIEHNLTRTAAVTKARNPLWSPDGRRLVYIAETPQRGSQAGIHLIDFAARARRSLTPQAVYVRDLSWSPESDRILYAEANEEHFSVRIVDLHGRISDVFVQRNLLLESPQWQPTGDSISFVVNTGRDTELLRYDFATSAMTRLTHQGAADAEPIWSPDGRWIAFRSLRTGLWENYLMRPDGSEVRRIANRANPPDFSPVWAPDSQAIAFSGTLEGNREIYVVAVGSTPDVPLHRLTIHPAPDSSPTWAPDGQRLAFVSNRDADAELYLVDRDGRNLRRLTHRPGLDFQPAWRPRP